MRSVYVLCILAVAGLMFGIAYSGNAAPHAATAPAFPNSPSEAAPTDAVKAIAAAFDKHPIVAIAEDHMVKQLGDLYIRLVQDPDFQKKCNDIVVEFVSRNNQPLLDRYINGEDIPADQVKRLWRDTFKVAAWDCPIYAQWLGAIREVNKKLPADKHLRVLAGDNAIDWTKMKTNADWVALGDNNVSFASVLTGEVLAKKRKALIVLGANHLTKNGDRTHAEDTTTLVQKKFPNSIYVVMFYDALVMGQFKGADKILAQSTPPAVIPLPSSPPLAALKNDNADRLDQVADAVLYLGNTSKVKPKLSDLDPAYLAEIERRAKLARPDRPEGWKTIFDK